MGRLRCGVGMPAPGDRSTVANWSHMLVQIDTGADAANLKFRRCRGAFDVCATVPASNPNPLIGCGEDRCVHGMHLTAAFRFELLQTLANRISNRSANATLRISQMCPAASTGRYFYAGVAASIGIAISMEVPLPASLLTVIDPFNAATRSCMAARP